MNPPALSASARWALVILGPLGGTASGFVLGTFANVLSALPALAGGGHAVGGAHTNYIPIGAVLGAVVGLAVGVWGFLHTAPKSPRVPRRPPGSRT